MYDLILDRANDSGQEYLLINICNGAPYTKSQSMQTQKQQNCETAFQETIFQEKEKSYFGPCCSQ